MHHLPLKKLNVERTVALTTIRMLLAATMQQGLFYTPDGCQDGVFAWGVEGGHLYGCEWHYPWITGQLDSLMDLMKATWPDICFPVGVLEPLSSVVLYLKGTIQIFLKSIRDEQIDALVEYTDIDWTADKYNRKSMSGYLFIVYGNVISGQAKCYSWPRGQ